MNGTEKAIVIMLFIFLYISIGFILLWAIVDQKDRKKDKDNLSSILYLMNNIIDDQSVNIYNIIRELEQLKEKMNDITLTLNSGTIDVDDDD